MTARPSPRLAAIFLGLSWGATVLVLLMGTLVLIGWAFSIPLLKNLFHINSVAMNPVAAMGLILGGVSMVLVMREPYQQTVRRKVSMACAVAILAIGVLKILSYRFPTHIDGLLFPDKLDGNQMGPNTTVAFITLGLSLALLDVRIRRGHRPAVPLLLLTGAIALLAITGYLYGVTSFYGVKGFIPMAPNTAVAFLLLSLAALGARPAIEPAATILSDTAGGVVARRLLPAATGLPLLVGYICLRLAKMGPTDRPLGFTLYSLITTVVFMILTWSNARFLFRLDISRRRAERKADEEHHLLRSLIDNIPDVVFVKDLQHRFLLNNIPHARALGAASPAEMLGKSDVDYFPPEKSAGMRNEEQQVTDTGVPIVDREQHLVLADGAKHVLSVTKAPFHDTRGRIVGIVGIAHDITRRKRAEEERDRFFTLSADMMCVAGFDGFFKSVNPAFETTLGYSTDELLNRPWLDFVHPDDKPATIAEGKKLSLGSVTLHFENRYLCKNGSYRWLSWTAVPVVPEQRIYAAARDMTERRRVEEQLREAIASEREAQKTLRSAQTTMVQAEKMAALGQMVAGVAHEINNPLSFVSNNVAVLQRDIRGLLLLLGLYSQSDPLLEQSNPSLLAEIHNVSQEMDLGYTLGNLQELLTRSREGLKRIQQIVKDLRNFARLDESDLSEVNLNDGIQSTITIIQGHAKKHGVQIVSDLGPLPNVLCYPAKVNQVVMNLLSNAIDATPQNGTVIVRTRASDNTHVTIEVADTGSGIDPAIREKIFDPFFTTKPQGQGTGLGLSISYGIIRDHNGSIDVQSEIGKGTRFVVTLPINAKVVKQAEAIRDNAI